MPSGRELVDTRSGQKMINSSRALIVGDGNNMMIGDSKMIRIAASVLVSL